MYFFVQEAHPSKVPIQPANKESIYIEDDEMLAFLKELEQESA